MGWVYIPPKVPGAIGDWQWRCDVQQNIRAQHVNPNVIMDAFRAYDDDVVGGIASQTALFAVDTNWTQDTDVKFHVALLATETAGGAANNYAFSVEYRKNGGAWTDLTTTTTDPIYAVTADNCNTADNASYGTTALTTGATIQATEYCNNADAANNVSLQSSSFEKTTCLIIPSAQNSDGDTIELRLTNNGTPLDADTTIPTITVNIPVTNQTIEIGQQIDTEALSSITVQTAITVTIGQVQETEVPQSKTVLTSLTQAIAIIPETELPQPFTVVPGEITEPIGLATDTETTFALTPNQSTIVPLGLVTETESLFALSSVVDAVITTGLNADAETLFSLTPIADQIISILQQTETETAQPMTVGTGGSEFYTILRLPTMTGTHTDFPVQITNENLPPTMIDGGANSCANGGGDVVAYSDIAMTNQIPLEVVQFVTGATPQVELWVKHPSASTGAIIVLAKSNSQVSQPAVTSTYGRNAVWSDYRQVYHMGSTVDSTGNGWDLTWQGTEPSLTDGLAPNFTQGNDFGGASGDCATFPADTDPITGRIFRNNLTDYEISVWFNTDTIGGGIAEGIFYPRDDADTGLRITGTGVLEWGAYAGASGNYVTDTVAISDSTWYLVHAVCDISANFELYKNASSVGTPIATLIADPDVDTGNYIGAIFSATSGNFDGQMGYLRVRNSLTSTDWKTAEYEMRDWNFSMYGDGWHNDVGSLTSPITVGATGTFDSIQRAMTALDRSGTLTENVEVRLTDDAVYDPEWNRTFETPNLNYNSFSLEVKGFGNGIHGGVWNQGARIARSSDANLMLPNSQLSFTDLIIWQQNEFGGDVTSGNSCAWTRIIARHDGGGNVINVFNGGSVIDSVLITDGTTGIPLNIGIDVSAGTFRNLTLIGGQYGMQTNGDVAHQIRNVVAYGYGTASVNYPNGSTNMDIDNCASADSGFGGTNEVTLSATDPFYDSANFDYHPNILGELYGQGTATGQSATDLAGQSWKTPPSIGALETNQEVAVITENTTAQNATPTVNGGNPYSGYDDVNINSASPDSHDGDGGFQIIDNNSDPRDRRSLVDITGLSNIPANATIVSALNYHRLVFSNINPRTVEVRRILQGAWDRNDATWNEYDADLNLTWNTAGCSGDGTDREATAIDSQSWNAVAGYQTPHDITSWVSDVVDGTITNDGLLFQCSTVGAATEFATGGSSDGTDLQRPELVVAYIPVVTGGAQTIAIGQVTETETAQPLTVVFDQFIALGLQADTETAQAITPIVDQVQAIGLVTDTETAQSITPVSGGITQAIGLQTDTETLFAITPVPGAVTIAIGLQTETETALSITPNVGGTIQAIGLQTDTETTFALSSTVDQVVAIGLVTETETAFSFGSVVDAVIEIGQVLDTDLALPISSDGSTVQPIGLQTDTETAQAMTVILDQSITLGLQTDSETAQTITPAPGPVSVLIGQNSETEIAQPITALTGSAGLMGLQEDAETLFSITVAQDGFVGIGIVSDTETAQPMTVILDQAITIGQIVETEQAQPFGVIFDQFASLGLQNDADSVFTITPTPSIGIAIGLQSDAETLFDVQINYAVPLGLQNDTETVPNFTPPLFNALLFNGVQVKDITQVIRLVDATQTIQLKDATQTIRLIDLT